MNFRFSLSLLILIISINSYSQSNVDSLKKLLTTELKLTEKAEVLNQLCAHYVYTNTDSSLFYGEQSIDLIELTEQSEADINLLYYHLGTAYLDNDLTKAYQFYKLSYKYSLKTKNDSLIAANHLALAAYFSRIPDIDSSSYYTTEATKHFKAIGDSVGLAYCYYNLMSSYNDVNNNEKAIEYGELGYNIAKYNPADPIFIHLTIGLAFNYSNAKNKAKLADEFIKKAKIIAHESNNTKALNYINLTLGSQKMKDKDYLSAIENYTEVLKYSLESKDSMDMSIAYNLLGKAYYKNNNFHSAAINFKKDILTNRNTQSNMQSDYLHLAMIYANIDKNQHHFYLNKYDSISTTIFKANSEEILAKYESSEKERQIELLKLKQIENDLIIQKKNFRNIILFIALLLLVFLISFLYYRNKNKQKILTQKIELEKQKVAQTENELGLKLDALKNNNKLISELKNKLKDNSNNEQLLNSIVSSFEESYVSEKQWDNIILQFNSLDNDFINKLKKDHSAITKNDIKLSILLKLNYSNSGMAEILNITLEGIKKAKQRLKKKKIKI